jgi:hypothetical protein
MNEEQLIWEAYENTNDNTDTNNKQEFLRELKTLLQKYNVSIQAGMESDPQAVYGEYIAIYDSTDKTVYRVDGWSLYDSDIK